MYLLNKMGNGIIITLYFYGGFAGSITVPSSSGKIITSSFN